MKQRILVPFPQDKGWWVGASLCQRLRLELFCAAERGAMDVGKLCTL